MHDESRASIGKAFAVLARDRDLAFAADLYRARAVLSCVAARMERSPPRRTFAAHLRSGGSRRHCRLNCALRETSHRSWPSVGKDGKPSISSRRSITNSPRDSTRPDLKEAKALLDELP